MSASSAAPDSVTATWRSSELGSLQNLWDVLKLGDVLLGDRLFCTWGLLAVPPKNRTVVSFP